MNNKSLLVFLIILAVIFGLLSLSRQSVTAQSSFNWPEISLTKTADGLTQPVHITHAGDDSGRLFVVEQAGGIQILTNGQVATTPFLDISDRVRSPASGGGSEEGLLSVAFPPGYGEYKDYFYVYYTRMDGNNQVSRFYITDNPNIGDPASEESIISFDHPVYENHNGGLLTFGPQGYLYIGTGDGGGGGDPFENAQDPSSLLGKLLRIDVEFFNPPPISGGRKIYLPIIKNGPPASYEVPTYIVPADNPFVGKANQLEEIWALGLRNPWRYTFDRLTDDLYIADVGQNAFEEVDFQPASSTGGENYGWDIMEGLHCYESTDCDQTGLVLPVAEYSRSDGGSITGGFVYRGRDNPTLEGIYFYGDFLSGKIWGLQNEITEAGRVWASKELLATSHKISTFGQDQSGELFLADYSAGEIYQISTP